MSTAKPNARFLPTLTEVVQAPPEFSAPSAASSAAVDAHKDMVQRVMEQLEAPLLARIEALLLMQAQNLLDGLRDEMKLAVTQAVEQALREDQ